MYSLSYILLLLVYCVMALIFHYANEQNKKTIKIISIVLFLLFFGFRGLVGDDWIIYYPSFDGTYSDNIGNMMYSIQSSGFEPGFMFLLSFCKYISNSYEFFIFVCSLINSALLFRFFLKRVDNLPFACVIFFCMSGIGLEVNLVRNSMALFICLNALEFITERKPLPYFLLCLLATSIHMASVIFFPLYFFINKKLNRWLYFSIFVFCNIFLLLQINFIGPIMLMIASRMGDVYVELVEAYIEGALAEIPAVISIGFLERLLTGVLIFCYYDKLINIRKENIIFINFFICYILAFSFLREFDVMARRVAILFVCSYWILWGDLLKCFHYKSNRYLFLSFIVCYSLLKVHSMTNEPKMEYDNVLFGAKSYEERYSIHSITNKK